MRSVLLLVLTLAACGDANAATTLGDPGASGTIVTAHIVSRVADAGVADDRPKLARVDEGVVMYVALEVKVGKIRHWYSEAGTVRVDGTSHATRPLAEAPMFSIAWSRVEPTAADTSNEASGSFRYESIDYRTTPLADGVARLDADVRPTLTPDHTDGTAPGLGTMRYQVEVTQDGRTIASPGTEARRGRGSGGLADSVHRISLRRDDTYLGYLTEMYGQPYIWASAGGTNATHQSERLEGSDCADFVVYGARRLGKDIPYVWTGGLPKYTKKLSAGTLGDDGLVYRDARGKALPFPRVGDLILFPRHVGVLAEDRGTLGVLDVDDLMMHTLFDSPKEQRIGDSGYAEKPLEVRRWK
jgi:hypothetical protein